MKPLISTRTIPSRMSGSSPRRVAEFSILRLVRGRTRWSIDGQEFELREGQGVLLMPGLLFGGLETLDAIPIVVEQIEWLPVKGGRAFSKEKFAQALAIDPGEAGLILETFSNAVPIFDFDTVSNGLFADLMHEPPAGESLALLHHRSVLLALVSRIAQTIAKGRYISPHSEAERKVAKFLLELESRCDEDWTLDGMAAGAGFKRSRFGILCRQLTGESPALYLNRLRIRRSRRMLRETDASITEVGLDCGFSSSQYFAKIFRRFQGHEPTHYRRISRKLNPGESAAYIKGDSARIVILADREIATGDFTVECELVLDRLGNTAASLEFGPDRFGFDGREGRIFLEGGTFGEVEFFERSPQLIREGLPFTCKLQRRGNRLSVWINDRRILSRKDDPERSIGKVGLRPLRNGIQVRRFEIDGQPVALQNLEG